jgi:hypothetical protein
MKIVHDVDTEYMLCLKTVLKITICICYVCKMHLPRLSKLVSHFREKLGKPQPIKLIS